MEEKKRKTYIGYVRMSSTDQNEARQLKALEDFGHPIHRIFIDKCSGKNADRPELKKMMDYVRDGDVLVVSEYARLARSNADMLRIVNELQKKGVEIISLREQLDTTTPQGRFMLTMFAGLAELERETIFLSKWSAGTKSSTQNSSRSFRFFSSFLNMLSTAFSLLYLIYQKKSSFLLDFFDRLKFPFWEV